MSVGDRYQWTGPGPNEVLAGLPAPGDTLEVVEAKPAHRPALTLVRMKNLRTGVEDKAFVLLPHPWLEAVAS